MSLSHHQQHQPQLAHAITSSTTGITANLQLGWARPGRSARGTTRPFRWAQTSSASRCSTSSTRETSPVAPYRSSDAASWASSIVWPLKRARRRALMLSGRGRLPTCVVRIRLVLVFILVVLLLLILLTRR